MIACAANFALNGETGRSGNAKSKRKRLPPTTTTTEPILDYKVDDVPEWPNLDRSGDSDADSIQRKRNQILGGSNSNTPLLTDANPSADYNDVVEGEKERKLLPSCATQLALLCFLSLSFLYGRLFNFVPACLEILCCRQTVEMDKTLGGGMGCMVSVVTPSPLC